MLNYYYSNYGKGGATTKSYITDKLPDVIGGQAKDLYFIALGINDCLQGIPIGTIEYIKSNFTLIVHCIWIIWLADIPPLWDMHVWDWYGKIIFKMCS